jgi:tetratricopeptide (TPR) repeat protein
VSFAEAAELFRRGDYLAAIDAFSRVLAQQPGLREAVEYQKLAYYNQGVAYVGKGNYAEALKMFERLRRIQPDFKRLAHYMQTTREKLGDQHYLAGIRLYKEQRLQEAIEEWNQALALNPRLESAKRHQEQARKLLKRLEEIK